MKAIPKPLLMLYGISLVEILDEIGTEVMKLRTDSMLEDSDSEKNY